MVTIQTLLNEKIFQYLKPLTKASTLERKVETVDLTEAPDVAGYTSPHAFMLTTAMAFKDDQELLKPFIDSLVAINVAGLGIKTSRFLGQLNPEIIDYANKCNFALIEIPAGTTLGYVAHTLFDFILDKRNQQVLYALEIQKFYSELVINNASIDRILQELGHIIDAPPLLLSPFLTISGESNQYPHKLTLSGSNLHIIKNAIKEMTHSKSSRSFEIRDNKGDRMHFNVHKVVISKSFPHYLIVLHKNDLSYPLSDFAIEETITALTYIIYKNQKVEESMMEMQFKYLNRIISKDNQSPDIVNSLIDQGLHHGFIASHTYRVLILDTKYGFHSSDQKAEFSHIVYNWVSESTLSSLRYSLAFFDEENLRTVILLQYDSPNFEEILEESMITLKRNLDLDVKVGIGSMVNQAIDIKNSYYEALEAIDNASKDILNYFKPKGIHTLLNDVETKTTQYFIEMQLKDFAQTDNEFNNELRTTLKSYLDHHGEIRATAEALFLHRNTILYRIKKAEEILGVDLNDPETTLSLRIALELFKTK